MAIAPMHSAHSGPSVRGPNALFVSVFVVCQKKDFDQVQKTLESIPAMSEIVKKSRTEFKKTIDRRDRLGYPLLQWSVVIIDVTSIV